MRLRIWVLLVGIAAGCACSGATYVSELPTVDQVIADYRVADPQQSAARQIIAFDVLMNAMMGLGADANGAFATEKERRIFGEYFAANQRIANDNPKAVARWRPPAEFRQSVSRKYLSQRSLEQWSANITRRARGQYAAQQNGPSGGVGFLSVVLAFLPLLSLLLPLLFLAVVIGFVVMVRSGRAKGIQQAQAAAMRPNLDAWNALGRTVEEREVNIKRMFDEKRASLQVVLRYDVQGSKIISELQKGTSTKASGCVEVGVRRNIGVMEPREREFLRSAYLLYNRALMKRSHWLYYCFALINGNGKAEVTYWKSWDLGVADGAGAARFLQDQLNATVESAISSLMTVVDTSSQAGQQPPSLVKEVSGRLRGGSAWLSAEEAATGVFAGDGPFALHLGVLDDGSGRVLSYAGEGSLMTIAPPGSGKTQCFVLPNLLQWPGPAVVLDIKGEIHESTSAWRAKHVGPVFRFSPLAASGSHSYNPLTFIRQDPDFLWEDARFLADMMIVPSGAADPFWENTARDILTASIAHVCYQNAPDDRAISKIMDLIYGIGWDEMVLALKTNLAVQAMRQTGHSLASMEKKTRDSALKTAQSSLSAWQGERLGLRASRATVYLCINPNEIDSYLSVVRVFIAQHIRMLTSALPPRGAAPILFVLDELPRLKKMPPVDEGLSIGRQYGIRLWMFAQSYGQLKEAYPNAEGMLGSCAVRTFMNVPLNDELAQKLSDQLGFRDGPLDAARTKLVEPLELAGPEYRDVALVIATNTKPARVRKAFAWQDPSLGAKMAPQG
jgi:type IV secretion system protein VirD4